MGISLRVMSNPHYQRNPVTGYFRLGQYQQVPNLKTVISVENCGKLRPIFPICNTKWRGLWAIPRLIYDSKSGAQIC